eukprot:gene3945-biopygen3244
MLRNDTRRTGLKLLALLLLPQLLTLPQAARAQTPPGAAVWPPKLVRIIVPFGPGSSPDIIGRLLADSLQARHPGTSFVIENKPGASGNIGTDAIAKSAIQLSNFC